MMQNIVKQRQRMEEDNQGCTIGDNSISSKMCLIDMKKNDETSILQEPVLTRVATPKLGAIGRILSQCKDLADAPIQCEDSRTLRKAVKEGDTRTLKDLKNWGKVTTEEIVNSAIDQDKVSILDEYYDKMNISQDLLDYSISKKAIQCARKISDSLGGLGDRALPMLKAAIVMKDTNFVLQLLDSHVNLADLPETPLHMAARSACAVMTRTLVQRNRTWMHQQSQDDAGHTPLHIAAKEGSVVVCLALLELNARVDAMDKKGRTPLYCCVESSKEGSIECMEILFKYKAQVDLKTSAGLTALHRAAMGKYLLGC